MSSGRELTRYARAVAAAWEVRLGKAVVFSPREWTTIERWYGQRIPLQWIREAIEASRTTERGRPAPAPRSLSSLDRKVRESWATVLEGRLEDQVAAAPEPNGASPPTDPDLAEASSPVQAPRPVGPAAEAGVRCRLARWSAAAEHLEPAGRAWLLELIERFGDDTAAAEAALERRLADHAGASRVRMAQERVAARLAPYRHRLDARALELAGRRALLRELRRDLDLPRLVD